MNNINEANKNYTTPEQSKQLLELGVPADSADCYLYKVAEYGYRVFIRQPYFKESAICGGSIPCWSIGQLLKIMGICYDFELPSCGSVQIYRTDIKKGSVIEVLISDITKNIHKMDFNKWRNGL